MSRSYRKPYSSWVCYSTIKQDRVIASRCFRRLEKQKIRQARGSDFEDYVHPVQFEASHNNVYSWSCDGLPRLMKEPTYPHDWALLFGEESAQERHAEELEWYARIKRK